MTIRPRTAFLAAATCVLVLAVAWFAAFHIGVFRHADQTGYVQFVDLQGHSRIDWIAHHLVSLFDPKAYLFVAIVPLLIALLRGRPRVAVAVGVIILGADASTEVLKHVLATPRPASLLYGYSPLPAASWPSGHSTAVMSAVLATVVAAPERLRPAAAALGASLAIAVGYSVVATGLHYPSDVLGGFLVAAAWTLAVVAGLLVAERRWPSSRASGNPISIRAALGAPGAVLAAGVVLGVILAVSRGHDLVSYARMHHAFVLEAAAIAALGLAVSTAVLLSFRRQY